MSICSFLVWKNACLNYREFDLEGDLVGVPHTWCLSTQSFITLLNLVWGEYDIVAMNEWKKKCVGLQWTWVSNRTVQLWIASVMISHIFIPPHTPPPILFPSPVARRCGGVLGRALFGTTALYRCRLDFFCLSVLAFFLYHTWFHYLYIIWTI